MLAVTRCVVLTLVAFGLAIGPAVVQTAPGPDPAKGIDPSAVWAVTLNGTTLYSGPAEDADAFGTVQPLVTLQVLDYSSDWAHVFNPRTRTEAYVPSDDLGPGDPPSRYVLLSPPAAFDEFDVRGIVTDATPLALYPTPADEATERELDPNTWLNLTGAVNGEDGAVWYRTDSGDFVPALGQFLGSSAGLSAAVITRRPGRGAAPVPGTAARHGAGAGPRSPRHPQHPRQHRALDRPGR